MRAATTHSAGTTLFTFTGRIRTITTILGVVVPFVAAVTRHMPPRHGVFGAKASPEGTKAFR